MSGDLSQDPIRLDYERLVTTTRIEELERLHEDRVQFVKKWKKFRKKLDEAFNVECPDRAPSCVAKKCQRLRQFVYHDQCCTEETRYARLKSWNTLQLSEIFGSFGLLSANEDQIEVYENCDNEEFKKQPMTKMFYAQALRRSGRIADAIAQLQELQYNYDAHIHGEASNYLGDCFTIQYETAEKLAEQLHKLQGGHFDCQKLQKRIQSYQKRFLTQEERDKDIGLTITLDTVREAAITARRKAQAAYDAHFTLTCSHEPLLRMLVFRSQERAELACKIENLERKRRRMQERHKQLEERIRRQTTLAKDSILSQGGLESHDYWIHSGQLEALCLGEETRINKYKPSLKRLCCYARGPHQLSTTMTRLQSIRDNFAQEGGKDQCCSVINDVCDFIRVSMSRLDEKGSATIDDLLDDGVEERPSEWMTDAEETIQRHLFEQTFNMRGMVCAPRPFLIPGGLSLVGGRVPDIIFSPADQPIFEKLLEAWNLNTVAPDDALDFCDRLIDRLRSVFSTHRLQQLHSEEHQQFDVTSDACIRMVGIPPEMRKGTDCSTNCSSALLFFGDCREHAFEMCAFFDFWQKKNINKLLLSAYQSLESSVEEMNSTNDQVSEQIHSILRSQLRGGHVGIYSPVRMMEKYKPLGWEDDQPMIYRPYNCESLLNQEPLSDYELRNSFLIIHYRRNQAASEVDSERSHVTVILPVWNDELEEDIIPHTDGVPTISDLDIVESVELFNLIEEHTTTFLVRTDVQGKQIIQCKDAFYNERYNQDDAPRSQICHYHLGNQQLDADDIVSKRSLLIGTLALLHDDNTTQQHDIRIRLLPHSRRTDTELIRGDPHRIHFMGMELNNLEVVGELLREEKTRATGKPSRRDVFLDRLYHYGKAKAAETNSN